jgi:peroxiredoxin (alkyl hydroperoxide reductase subunit C)
MFNILKINSKAPEFELKGCQNSQTQNYSNSDFLGQYVVLFFYSNDFVDFCQTEILKMNQLAIKLSSNQADRPTSQSPDQISKTVQIIGCSTDSPFVHLAWIKELEQKLEQDQSTKIQPNEPQSNKILYPLISDIHHSVCIDYNVFVEETANALNGTFIIDPSGNLRWYQISDNNIPRNTDQLLEVLNNII